MACQGPVELQETSHRIGNKFFDKRHPSTVSLPGALQDEKYSFFTVTQEDITEMRSITYALSEPGSSKFYSSSSESFDMESHRYTGKYDHSDADSLSRSLDSEDSLSDDEDDIDCIVRSNHIDDENTRHYHTWKGKSMGYTLTMRSATNTEFRQRNENAEEKMVNTPKTVSVSTVGKQISTDEIERENVSQRSLAKIRKTESIPGAKSTSDVRCDVTGFRHPPSHHKSSIDPEEVRRLCSVERIQEGRERVQDAAIRLIEAQLRQQEMQRRQRRGEGKETRYQSTAPKETKESKDLNHSSKDSRECKVLVETRGGEKAREGTGLKDIEACEGLRESKSVSSRRTVSVAMYVALDWLYTNSRKSQEIAGTLGRDKTVRTFSMLPLFRNDEIDC